MMIIMIKVMTVIMVTDDGEDVVEKDYYKSPVRITIMIIIVIA